jgi:hypothetical protein
MKTYTRLNKIQKSKGFSISEGIFLVVLPCVLGGWGGIELAGAIGMLFPPLGAILGYC